MRVKKKTHPIPDMNSEALKEFRQAAYELLVKAKDATFELMDAVMTTRNAACLAEFSLSPLFTRQWSSIYEALDLLRESGGRSKFKIENSRNEVESQTKTFASIAIAFSQNPKYFKLAVNIWSLD